MSLSFRILGALLGASLPLLVSGGQQVTVVVSDARPGHGFSGYSAAPISQTTVLHSGMDASDSGATLGFAIAIRGPSGWYNTKTSYGDISKDSLPAGVIGQWWQVGERRYRFVYDEVRKTLSLFDTTLDLSQSRVVLVTLPSEVSGRATVALGQPVSVQMTEPVPFAMLLLPKAPEVRAFAGLFGP